MSRKKKGIDRLTADVLEAERLGYGCHYGDYIAARDADTEGYRRRLREAPRSREAVCRPEIINGPVVITKEGERYCQVCGKPLGRKEKKYCKGECQSIGYDRTHAKVVNRKKESV